LQAEKKLDDTFSRFNAIHECDGQTDGHRTTSVPRYAYTNYKKKNHSESTVNYKFKNAFSQK